jgi:CRISPR system Cascade subunit CasE
MYLSRLCLNRSRQATLWASNSYRVHQRLKIACEGDPRLLFRIEDSDMGTQILVQSHNQPEWQAAFADFPVLQIPPEQKLFDPQLETGRRYRFRLLANPSVKKTVESEGTKGKTRQGLIHETDQIAWLKRKLETAGTEVQECIIAPRGLQRSRKNPFKEVQMQTHLAVLFEGILLVKDAELLKTALENGIGSAKGFGFGLLSLAPTQERG